MTEEYWLPMVIPYSGKLHITSLVNLIALQASVDSVLLKYMIFICLVRVCMCTHMGVYVCMYVCMYV